MIKLFSPESNDNTLLVTEQCNNRCLMCCQPPKKRDDFSFFEQKNEIIISSSPENIECIGITGGEPTLLGNRLFTLLEVLRQKYPNALIHILTNGRLLNPEYVAEFVKFDLANIVFAVPLHSDFSSDHDKITRVMGSYNETLKGLYALAKEHARVELRIIINALNFRRLPRMAEFIHYNLPFVEDIVFIGMEAVGDAVKNKQKIWIDPVEYQSELRTAALYLNGWNYEVGISNIPLCLLPSELHRFSWHSISDWKVAYLPCCDVCDLRSSCGGVFATAKWQSDALHPVMSASNHAVGIV